MDTDAPRESSVAGVAGLWRPLRFAVRILANPAAGGWKLILFQLQHLRLAFVDLDPRDLCCLACFRFDFDHDAGDLDIVFGNVKWQRAKSGCRGEYFFNLPAKNTLMRPSHPHIGDVGRTARQDLFVSRRDVSVRSANCGHAPVQMAPHQLLVTGGLGVEIDEVQIKRPLDEGESHHCSKTKVSTA